ncbi:hypothetical protein L7F22_036476 [Adiantum nelumboides]|nr:hypothetical protein [Adiantum nelumboides]
MAVDDLSCNSSDYAANSWVTWFLSTKGNEYFCEVDEDYILDRFNLTASMVRCSTTRRPSISSRTPLVSCGDRIARFHETVLSMCVSKDDLDDEARDYIEAQARLLYGLVHARYIITTRGLAKMLEKYKRADFGRCPRVLCYQQALLPVGLSDQPFPKGRQALLPALRGHLQPKIESTRHNRRRLLRQHLPTYALHGVSAHAAEQVADVAVALFALPGCWLFESDKPRWGVPGGGVGGTGGPGGKFMQDGTGAGGQQGDGDSPTSLASRRRQLARAARRNREGQGQESGNGLIPGAGAGAGGRAEVEGPAGAPGGSTANAALKVERYRPRIFGFPTHETAKLHRWQERQRDIQIERLERAEAGVIISAAPDAGVGPEARTGTGGLDLTSAKGP